MNEAARKAIKDRIERVESNLVGIRTDIDMLQHKLFPLEDREMELEDELHELKKAIGEEE